MCSFESADTCGDCRVDVKEKQLEVNPGMC